MDAITIAAVLIFLLATLALWIKDDRTCSWLSKQKTVLILTAHPDDECMFFGPLIVALLSKGVSVRILCMSAGNWYGQGQLRTEEFYASCRALGLSRSSCYVTDDPLLPDNPDVDWNLPVIQSYVDKFVKEHKVTALVTFDAEGVSGHSNHIALYNALQSMSLPGIPKYKLLSVPILRKYSSIFDILTSLILREKLIFTPFHNVSKPYKAMFEHGSQLLWFRYLYISFSRYMFLNTIDALN